MELLKSCLAVNLPNMEQSVCLKCSVLFSTLLRTTIACILLIQMITPKRKFGIIITPII